MIGEDLGTRNLEDLEEEELDELAREMDEEIEAEEQMEVAAEVVDQPSPRVAATTASSNPDQQPSTSQSGEGEYQKGQKMDKSNILYDS